MAIKNNQTEDMLYDALRQRIDEQKPKPIGKEQKLSNDEAFGEAYNIMRNYFVNEAETMQVQGTGEEAMKNILANVAQVGMAYLDQIGVKYTEDNIQELVNRLAEELESYGNA